MAVQWNPDPGWCVLFFPNHFESSVPEAVPRLLFFILFFGGRQARKQANMQSWRALPEGRARFSTLTRSKAAKVHWGICEAESGSSCSAHVLRTIFFPPVLGLSGPWLFNSARLRKTSSFFLFGQYRMQGERKRRALTTVQYTLNKEPHTL